MPGHGHKCDCPMQAVAYAMLITGLYKNVKKAPASLFRKTHTCSLHFTYDWSDPLAQFPVTLWKFGDLRTEVLDKISPSFFFIEIL